jgi:predicted glycosyltransferase
MVGTDASIAQVGKLLGVQTVTILEDDFSIIRELALLTFPFTSNIVVPAVCDTGPFKRKKIGYPGYMKLAYLAPGIFEPDPGKVAELKKPYCLLRLSALQAHHVAGVKGVSEELLKKMVGKLKKRMNVYISSEKELKEEFKPHQLETEPADIHHVLHFSELFISDSQSMTVEAALLGVPSIRYSDFVGKISVLNELEDYGLTYGVIPGRDEELWKITDEILTMENRHTVFRENRESMLRDKIDVSAFFTWFLSEYPGSVEVVKQNPGYLERFRFDDDVIE